MGHLLAPGVSGPELAGDLHLTHIIVRTDVRHRMNNLGVGSRAQLVAQSPGDGLDRVAAA